MTTVRTRARILVLFDGRATWHERLVLAEVAHHFFIMLDPAGYVMPLRLSDPKVSDVNFVPSARGRPKSLPAGVRIDKFTTPVEGNSLLD